MYDEIFFSPRKMMKNYNKRPDINNRSKKELEIMISTIEIEIQRTTGAKSIFLSTISIVMAIIILVLGNYSPNSNFVIVFVLILYIFLFFIFFFVTNKEIDKLYYYLNELRYVISNKQ